MPTTIPSNRPDGDPPAHDPTARPAGACAGLAMPHVEGVEHRYTQVDGLRLHYAEAGQGDPLVLLHGWPEHWWSWRYLIGPLSERYRVICPDIRGLGWSEGGRNYSLARLARDVVELMDTLGIQRAGLIGHDWGNVAGYRACLNWPDRFTQYIALGGVHPWSASGSAPRVFLRPWHVYLLAFAAELGMARLRIPEHCLRSWRHRGQFTTDELTTYASAIHRPVSVDATRRFDRNIVLHEIAHFARHYRLMHLRVSTLHLNGEHDPLTRGLSDSYSDYADDMRLEHVPACGHFIAEERPDWLLNRLENFLA